MLQDAVECLSDSLRHLKQKTYRFISITKSTENCTCRKAVLTKADLQLDAVRYGRVRGGNYEECRLLGCDVVCSVRRLLVTVNAVPSSRSLLHSDDGSDTFLCDVGSY
jgi:hypothetical protein